MSFISEKKSLTQALKAIQDHLNDPLKEPSKVIKGSLNLLDELELAKGLPIMNLALKRINVYVMSLQTFEGVPQDIFSQAETHMKEMMVNAIEEGYV